tara:strand:- start:418 stop:654 length:237 start_codon:yes stop_codon:yes gene_type:complete
MPKHYGDDEPKDKPMTAPKSTSRGGKLTDKQKAELKKHMEKMHKGGMSASEMKSHRMKLMVRMRKGMSVNKAHKEISK